MSQNPRDEDYDWENQVGARRFSLRPRNPKWAIVAGYVVSQMVGWGALAVVTAIFSHFDFLLMGARGFWILLSQFFLIPWGMGVVAAYFWVDEYAPAGSFSFWPDEDAPAGSLNDGRLGGSSFLNTLLVCVGASFLWSVGVIVLLPVWVLVWLFMCLGVGMGTPFWRKTPF
ncbi:MAG: hypothetical protein KY445_03940 [Armatimonadetes bacterium]|nr:hypothetical protein [Armatimonadota bacterium]